jgi:hypothetical protein
MPLTGQWRKAVRLEQLQQEPQIRVSTFDLTPQIRALKFNRLTVKTYSSSSTLYQLSYLSAERSQEAHSSKKALVHGKIFNQQTQNLRRKVPTMTTFSTSVQITRFDLVSRFLDL